MCPGAAECAFNQEQKSRSWACPQRPDGSIAPPGCRSWAGLPWGWGQPARSPSYGEGSTLHPPALLAHYPSQPVYLAGGLVIADPGHPTSSAGCQRSVPALTATSPFSDTLQKDANRTRSRILAQRARMYRSRATQEVSVDTGWRKDVYQRHLRAVSWGSWHRPGCGQTAGIGAGPHTGWGPAGPAPPGCQQRGG